MRGESPTAADDDPHRQADLGAGHGGLQFTVADLHDLVGDAVDAQIGVTGTGVERRLQRGIGQLQTRDGKEVGVDIAGCHGLIP